MADEQKNQPVTDTLDQELLKSWKIFFDEIKRTAEKRKIDNLKAQIANDKSMIELKGEIERLEKKPYLSSDERERLAKLKAKYISKKLFSIDLMIQEYKYYLLEISDPKEKKEVEDKIKELEDRAKGIYPDPSPKEEAVEERYPMPNIEGTPFNPPEGERNIEGTPFNPPEGERNIEGTPFNPPEGKPNIEGTPFNPPEGKPNILTDYRTSVDQAREKINEIQRLMRLQNVKGENSTKKSRNR